MPTFVWRMSPHSLQHEHTYKYYKPYNQNLNFSGAPKRRGRRQKFSFGWRHALVQKLYTHTFAQYYGYRIGSAGEPEIYVSNQLNNIVPTLVETTDIARLTNIWDPEKIICDYTDQLYNIWFRRRN